MVADQSHKLEYHRTLVAVEEEVEEIVQLGFAGVPHYSEVLPDLVLVCHLMRCFVGILQVVEDSPTTVVDLGR